MFNFSPFVVGTMRLGQWGAGFSSDEYELFIDQCLELGLVDFDFADIYGGYTSEAEFGEVLKRRKDLRPKIRITTKCGIKMISANRANHNVKSYDTSRQHVINSVNQSLKDLGTDYIDLLLIHRPDYLMNYEALAETVNGLKQEGKIKYFGVSNFSVSQVETLSKFIKVDNHQIEFSLKEHSAMKNGILDQCVRSGISPSAWSPLAGGDFFQGKITPNSDIDNCLNELEEKYGLLREQMLLSWILKHPAGITPILGSTKILRYSTAMEALDAEIASEDWYKIFEAFRGKEVL